MDVKMINLKNIVSNSIPSFVGTIKEIQDARKILSYVKANMCWLKEFNRIVFSLNGDGDSCQFFIDTIRSTYPTIEPTLLFSESNLGHTFGTLDNDRKIYEYATNDKNKDIQYVWKFSADVIADASLMNVEIDDKCGFFYINNIGYAAFASFDNKKEKLLEAIMNQTYFYPQTNYYIYKTDIKEWSPEYEEIYSMKDQYDQAKIKNPNINPWEVLSGDKAFLPENEGCACEAYLAKTIKKAGIKSQHLLSEKDTQSILDLIKKHNIHDGSHKNIVYSSVGSICHYHVMNGRGVTI